MLTAIEAFCRVDKGLALINCPAGGRNVVSCPVALRIRPLFVLFAAAARAFFAACRLFCIIIILFLLI